MKFLAYFFLTATLIPVSLSAQIRNPLIRNCVINQGQFYISQVNESDARALCLFEDSVTDAQSIMEVTTEQKISKALGALKRNNDATIFCNSFGGRSLNISVQGIIRYLCFFDDSSMIDLETLRNGEERAPFFLKRLLKQ